MSIDLGRRLVTAGLISPAEVEAALFISVVRGVPFSRVLLDRGSITERALEEEIERAFGLGQRGVEGSAELVSRLPRAMCRRLAAVPTRLDPVTNTVDIAAADPLDPHLRTEFGFHLGASIRVVRAPIGAVEEAIRRIELVDPEVPSARSRPLRASPAAPISDETPIPLVRRIAGLGDDVPFAPQLSPASDEQSLPLPLRHAKYVPRAALEPNVDPGLVSQTLEAGLAEGTRPETPAYGTEVAAVLRSLRRPNARRNLEFPPDSSNVEGEPGTLRPSLLEPAAPPDHAMEPVRASLPRPVTIPLPALPLEPAPPSTPSPPASILSADRLFRSLSEATSRDEVVRLALRGLLLLSPRVAIFAVRRDGFHGWACNADFGELDALRGLAIAQEVPSVLATAAVTGLYLGPIPATVAHAGLLQIMRQRPTEVAVSAVRVGGRPAMILLADELSDPGGGTQFMEELSRAVGGALARLLSDKA